MAEPKLIGKRQSINQPVSVAGGSKSASQKAVREFSSQNNIVKNTLPEPSRDSLANILSKKSASNDSTYPKCSSSTGNKPCIVDSGYKDKRAYLGSGMAGWKEAGLAGNTNKQLSAGFGASTDIFIFAIGASAEVSGRTHGSSVCLDLTACIQIGMGLHAGAGFVMNGGTENITSTANSASIGGFGNVFGAGGSVSASDNSLSVGKGVFGAGVGASGGVQGCFTAIVKCTKQ